MRNYFFQCVLTIFFLANPNLWAQDSKVGTSSANFMKIGVGARAIGLGGAYVSIVNDLTSMYWNPAGLVRNMNMAMQFERVDLYADISHNFAGLSIPLSDNFIVGLNAIYLTSGDIEITTESDWEGSGQFYDVTNMALGLAIARKMTNRLAIGLNAKYIREEIWRNAAKTFAFDFGLILDTDIYGFDIGMSLTNVGGAMHMSGIDMQFAAAPENYGLLEVPAQELGEDWTLPTAFRVGISSEALGRDSYFFKSEQSSLLAGIDLSSGLDTRFRTNVGLEYEYAEQFTIRYGYRLGYDEVSFSLGTGVKLRLGGLGIVSFDYAYTDYGVLDGRHRFGILIWQ